MSVNIDSPINMSRKRFLTAAEAAAALGVRRSTLYAYVSRGLLRSESDPARRGRRYPAADVEALRRRGEGGGGAARSPAGGARRSRLGHARPGLERESPGRRSPLLPRPGRGATGSPRRVAPEGGRTRAGEHK